MIQPADLGPIYTETDLSRFPVEPWNTISNLLFLVVALYWFVQVSKEQNREFKAFLKLCLPLLFIGYIGGSLYHATRAHFIWMVMDVAPIYVIALLTAIYQWQLVQASWKTIFLIFVGLLFIPVAILWLFVPFTNHTPTIGYVILALPILLPTIIDQLRLQGKLLWPFARVLLLLTIALAFRVLDSQPWVQVNMSVGAHWLWHSVGAATCHFLLVYMRQRAHYLV